MGFFDFLRGPDINAGVETFRKTPGAALLDVRTPEEYAQGHIEGAVNVPADEIGAYSGNPSAAVFTYCLSGARSARAAAALKRRGYENVTDIGGIGAYRGKVVK